MSAPFPWLVADVRGGTNCPIWLREGAGRTGGAHRGVVGEGHAGPAEAAQAYLEHSAARFEGFERPRSRLAVATAARPHRVVLTNRGLGLREKAVAQALVLDVLIPLNDFRSAGAVAFSGRGAGTLLVGRSSQW